LVKKHVVVVCGYGCHLVPELKEYLNRVVEFIHKHSPDLIIFCGGLTQRKSAPYISEADLMYDYVVNQLNLRFQYYLPLGTVCREDTSYTTLGNIEKSAIVLDNYYNNINEKITITIFCEATRSTNVIMLARHFMLPLVETIDDIRVETSSWERADPFKQVGNLIYNKLAITYPWLGLAKREHDRRIKRSEQI
jgi:hypothetical protein